MKNLIPTLSVLAVVLVTGACTSHPTTLPPGEYSKTHKSTDAAGTTRETTTNTEVYYDEHGRKRVIQEQETSEDPEGLFNKSTSKTTKTY
ncbi:MAG TPA: hypothetical protein PLO23_00075 [Alphaproteobacteria bacterium]|nr:hypothetical protein [Alphaproteobacteria bacterium]